MCLLCLELEGLAVELTGFMGMLRLTAMKLLKAVKMGRLRLQYCWLNQYLQENIDLGCSNVEVLQSSMFF